jgi:hypothetical protein
MVQQGAVKGVLLSQLWWCRSGSNSSCAKNNSGGSSSSSGPGVPAAAAPLCSRELLHQPEAAMQRRQQRLGKPQAAWKGQ